MSPLGLRYTTESFIEKSKKIHGDKYNYEKTIYKGSTTKVIIICKNKHIFYQEPRLHLSGHGCKKCGDVEMGFNNRVPFNIFLEKAILKFGYKYTYLENSYVYNPNNKRTTINIICPIHGVSNQRTDVHLNSMTGCYKCSCSVGAGTRTKSLETYIKQVKAIHGDTYDYSKVKLLGHRIPIEIICKKTW